MSSSLVGFLKEIRKHTHAKQISRLVFGSLEEKRTN
jgi:hypothetical protein